MNKKKSNSNNECPYKIVISDLDGTLFNNDHIVSNFTKNIINQLTQKGIIFSIATGRHYLDAKYTLEKLNVESILITSNGAMINDNDGTRLFLSEIPSDIVKSIASIKTLPKNMHFHMYTPDKWLVSEESSHLLNESHIGFHKSGFNYEVVPLKDFHLFSCVKLYFTTYPDQFPVKEVDNLYSYIEDTYGDKIEITFSNFCTFEIMNNGINKSFSVQKLLEYENLSPEDAMIFGDGMNDFEMLRDFPNSFLMANAQQRVLNALPNHPIIGTNDEDGVAKHILDNILNYKAKL